MDVKVVVALNMSDVAESRGYKINIEKLSAGLGARVIPTVASREQGVEELKEAIVAALEEVEEEGMQ